MTQRIGCDIAVVGAGSGGCVVAGRLACESEARVVLLEAGPDYGPRSSGRWPADLLDGAALVTSHDWGYTSGELPGREPLAFPRARVMGGCSSHNGCIAAVGCRADYDGWATLTGDPRWSAESVRPVFARAMERMRVRTYADDEVGPFHRACLEAAAAFGLPRADDLDDLDGGIGFGVEPVNIEDGARINAAFAYVDPARERPSLTIVDGALCDRIVPAAGARNEVVAWRDGEELRVDAGTVVLAGGTYGTPAILQRSGIGDPERLRSAGVAPVAALPGVGENLHDHPLAEIEFEGTGLLRRLLDESAAVRFTPEEQTLGKLASSLARGPYDLHLVPVAAHAQSLLAGRVMLVVGVMDPLSRGRLHVTGADPDAAPAIDHGYLTDRERVDLAVLTEGVAIVRELAATAQLRPLLGDEVAATFQSPLERFHAHYYHPTGTCAMGPDGDRFAVCDGAGRVRGLEGVVVADCSLMPAIPRANTNMPAVMVGEVIADSLLAER